MRLVPNLNSLVSDVRLEPIFVYIYSLVHVITTNDIKEFQKRS